LTGRASIDIAFELDMKTVAFFSKRNLEIAAIERLLNISTSRFYRDIPFGTKLLPVT